MKKNAKKTVEGMQRRATKMIKGLKAKSYAEWLRELSLSKRRIGGTG